MNQLNHYPISWWVKTNRTKEYVEHDMSITRFFYKNLETGQEIIGRDLPIGACYEVPVYKNWPGHYLAMGYDGKCVVCKLPNGHIWHIDGRCRNCTRPDEDHRCWVRHGSIGDKLHVDKAGNTCSAGAGSILSGEFHGYLHNGILIPA